MLFLALIYGSIRVVLEAVKLCTKSFTSKSRKRDNGEHVVGACIAMDVTSLCTSLYAHRCQMKCRNEVWSWLYTHGRNITLVFCM